MWIPDISSLNSSLLGQYDRVVSPVLGMMVNRQNENKTGFQLKDYDTADVITIQALALPRISQITKIDKYTKVDLTPSQSIIAKMNMIADET